MGDQKMYNIIKSMHYFAKRDIPLLVALITLLAVPVIAAFYSVSGGETIRDVTGCRYVTGIAPDLSLFALIACMLITSRIAGADAGDRTINYELLSGHARAEAYFGRTVAGLLWGGVLVFVLQWLPAVYFSACNGWGPEADPGDAALRCGLLLVVLFRIVAFSVLVTTLARGAGKGMVFLYLLLEAEAMFTAIVEEMTEFEFRWWTMFTAWGMVTTYDNAKSVVVDGKEITRFVTEVPAGTCVMMIAVSACFGIFYLIAGYLAFRGKDRD